MSESFKLLIFSVKKFWLCQSSKKVYENIQKLINLIKKLLYTCMSYLRKTKEFWGDKLDLKVLIISLQEQK